MAQNIYQLMELHLEKILRFEIINPEKVKDSLPEMLLFRTA